MGTLWNPLWSVEVFAVAGCLLIWAWIAWRSLQGHPVAPYRPRRPVPWNPADVAVILVFYFLLQGGVIELVRRFLDGCPAGGASGAASTSTVHMIGQLIAHGNPWVLVVCGISAILVAPLSEEFFFRVLFQGCLESMWRRWRRHMPGLHRFFGNGIVPVTMTAFLFAVVHFRVGAPKLDARFWVLVLAGDAIARLATIVFAIVLLRTRVGATAADFGWKPHTFWRDVELGVGMFWAVTIPVYAMQAELAGMLPDYIAPDPIPLFFLGLALGILYYRTHRILPLVVLHAVFNGTSFLLVWIGCQT